MDIHTVAYLVGRKLIKLTSRLFYQIDVKSEANLPPGPKIFAINHPTTIDPFLIATLNREPLVTLIHHSVFTVPVFGWLLRLSGNIPVYPDRGYLAFDQAAAALSSGKNVAIYIEGGLTDENVSRPKTGAVRLSILTGRPIVPIGVALDIKNVTSGFNTFGGSTDRTVWYGQGPYNITLGKPQHIRGSLKNREFIRGESVRILAQVKRLEAESHKRLIKLSPDFSLILHWFRLAYSFLV